MDELKWPMRRALKMLVSRTDTLPLPFVPAMWMVGWVYGVCIVSGWVCSPPKVLSAFPQICKLIREFDRQAPHK